MLPQSEKPAASFGVLALNVLVCLVFGCQNLSSYFAELTTPSVALSAGCFLLAPAIAFEMYWYRNKDGRTWHARYGDTPAGQILLGIVYVCFWSFAVHAVLLLARWNCNICTGNPASGKSFFRVAYWLHVMPSLVIALAAPLQFTPRIRRLKDFQVHRWVGRAVLLASAVHQASATVLFTSELLFSRVDCASVSAAEASQCGWRYRVYVAGFIPKNLVAWAAMTLGLRAARRGDFAQHGLWMCRLGAMWVITIVVAHIIIDPVGLAVGPEWKYAVGEWAEWLFVVPAEIYLRRSGRFGLEGKDGRDGGAPPKISAEPALGRPFLP